MKQRIEFFLKLVGHQDSRIRELAYLELGRAPYPMVRQLGRVVPREAIEPMLQGTPVFRVARSYPFCYWLRVIPSRIGSTFGNPSKPQNGLPW